MKKINNSGFSLIEVLIFITILSLFFITASAITTTFLRNMKNNEYKILATRYAEELLEWLRGEKEVDWNNFIEQKANKTYCFSTSPITQWPQEGSCSSYDSLNPPIYKREVVLTTDNQQTQVNVNIIVSWQESNNIYSVPINTVFTLWE